MLLTWYGTASLILQEGDTSIAFDPFCGMTRRTLGHPEASPQYDRRLCGVSDVFVTHGHLDHIYHIPWLYGGAAAAIHCTAAPGKTLARLGLSPEKIHLIGPGFSSSFGPFQITAYQGRHCVFDLPLLRRTIFSVRFWQDPLYLAKLLHIHFSCRENGEILFYEAACRGLRIQIMGSMNLDPDTSYPQDADILILPLQGRSDQDTYALELVERLRPRSIFLDHYDDTFPPLSGHVDISGFIQNVDKRFGIPCRPLELKKGITIHGKE